MLDPQSPMHPLWATETTIQEVIDDLQSSHRLDLSEDLSNPQIGSI